MPNPLTRFRNFIADSTSKRSYEAAAGGRRWHRQPVITNPVQAIQISRTAIANRARAVVANDPLAISGVMAWRDG